MILEYGTLDHKPIIIHPCGVLMKPNKSWRFEQMWLKEESCQETVTAAWRDGEGISPMGRVVDKMRKCQTKLKWWSKRCLGNITWEIAEKKKQRKEAKSSTLEGINVENLVKLKNELAGLVIKEE